MARRIKPTPKDSKIGTVVSFEEVQRHVEEMAKSDKPPVIVSSSDPKGHSILIRFSAPKWWAGAAERVMTLYPQCRSITDAYRACFYAGLVWLIKEAERYDVQVDDYTKELYLYNRIIEIELNRRQMADVVRDTVSKLSSATQEGLITMEEMATVRDNLVDKLARALEISKEEAHLLTAPPQRGRPAKKQKAE